MLVVDNALGGISGSELVGNDGIRVTVANTARLDLTVARNDFDELPANSFDVNVTHSAQAHVQFHNNLIVNSAELVRTAGEPAVRFQARNTATLTGGIEDNDVFDIKADNLQVVGSDSSLIRVTIVDNQIANAGNAVGHRGIAVISDAASSATINAQIHFNQIVSPFDRGIALFGNGSAVFNVRVTENFVLFSPPAGPGEPATFNPNGVGISRRNPERHPSSHRSRRRDPPLDSTGRRRRYRRQRDSARSQQHQFHRLAQYPEHLDQVGRRRIRARR
jgi:hypothetical protein